MKIEIEIPETQAVEMRNGAEVTLDYTKINTDILAQMLMLGGAQKVRNFAASALMNVKARTAGAQRNDESDVAYKKRVEAVTVSTEELFEESQSCLEAGLKRLEAGDWGAERSSGGIAADPLDKWRLAVMRDIMKSPDGAALKAKHDAIPSEDQKARRELLLSIATKNAEMVDAEAIKRRDASKFKIAGLTL